MSHPASSPFPSAPAEGSAPPARRSRFTAFLTAIGAIVLIGSEIWLAAIASVWALDGVLGLSTVGDLVMIAIVAPIALWATWMIAKLAIAAELNPENAD
ncbi:hypothetical protein SAMN05877838_2329 [Hoeflea halophila]|uniref:Uncharacterized protein n=1 Tax=Hoeflea halophila TaxID=714899 RepID=A0A286IBE8_9HYPH|nr:hypothetical protein [Hoeflea halophila]SOE17430.1 hypothetical protein SAMN05877838_2329 [Hoeflea halophila]